MRFKVDIDVQLYAPKVVIKNALAGHTVAIAIYSVTKMKRTCSPMIGQLEKRHRLETGCFRVSLPPQPLFEHWISQFFGQTLRIRQSLLGENL